MKQRTALPLLLLLLSCRIAEPPSKLSCIAESCPERHGQVIGPAEVIFIRFHEAMDPVTVLNCLSASSREGILPGTWQHQEMNSWCFLPERPLPREERLYLRLSGVLRSAAGNQIRTDYTIPFIIASELPDLSFHPETGCQISPREKILIRFASDRDRKEIEGKLEIFAPGTGPNLQWSSNNQELAIEPVGCWVEGTKLRISLGPLGEASYFVEKSSSPPSLLQYGSYSTVHGEILQHVEWSGPDRIDLPENSSLWIQCSEELTPNQGETLLKIRPKLPAQWIGREGRLYLHIETAISPGVRYRLYRSDQGSEKEWIEFGVHQKETSIERIEGFGAIGFSCSIPSPRDALYEVKGAPHTGAYEICMQFSDAIEKEELREEILERIKLYSLFPPDCSAPLLCGCQWVLSRELRLFYQGLFPDPAGRVRYYTLEFLPTRKGEISECIETEACTLHLFLEP